MLAHMSISGAFLILFILAVRTAAVNRLPKRIFVLLWEIAALRLLIPFDLPFRYGIVSPAAKETVKAVKSAGAPVTGESGWLSVIWLAGTVVIFLVLVIRYRMEYRRFADALPVPEDAKDIMRMLAGIPKRVKILVSDRTSTPLAAGIIDQRIILPKHLDMDGENLKYILAHEMTHIARADNLKRFIMLLTVCIHWFNPLVWTMYLFFDRDIEMSCDEKVLRLYGEKQKKEYAQTLLDLAETQYQCSLFLNGFGKSAIQERIVAIMKYKKIGITGIVCAVLLAGSAMTVFAGGDSDASSKSGANDVQVKIETQEGETDEYRADIDQTDEDVLNISIYPEAEQ